MLMRKLADYVQANCQNDLTILLSSGFLPTKTPSPVGPVGAPQDLRLTRTGFTGQLRLRYRPVYGTRAGYNVQTAEDPEGPFADYATTSSTRLTLNDLTPLKTCWVRVRSTGTDGPGPWSEPTCAMVL